MFTLAFNSPIGFINLTSDEESVISLMFVDSANDSSHTVPEILLSAKHQLTEYFNGTRKYFDLLIAPQGTEFQMKVWKEVSKIQFGETATYLDIAKATGSARNTRAVGFANGKNPLPIIIPCHRIIGSNGKLTGYAGGLNKKRWLLKHEIENTKIRNTLF
jgi:methylated-DNA-[protein]-cysteine S-methyltransferase